MKKLLLIPALALAGFGVAEAATNASSVKAKEVEFHIALNTSSAKHGKITFTVKNAGKLPHQFLVLKTKLAAGKLPQKGPIVNVAKAGKLFGGIAGAGVKAGATKTFSLTLPAGHYVFFCNIKAHYAAGQRIGFTVK